MEKAKRIDKAAETKDQKQRIVNDFNEETMMVQGHSRRIIF